MVVMEGAVNADLDDHLSSVECFTMGDSTWKYLPSMSEGRSCAVAEVLPSTRKYVLNTMLICNFSVTLC